jgi:hypothetical protein
MSWSSPHQQPSQEQIAKIVLEFAKKRFFIRTFERDAPLFKCALVLPKLGKHVMVELMPSLALRVRDNSTGEILAQSMPADFDTLDMTAPAVEDVLNSWSASRASATSPRPGDKV